MASISIGVSIGSLSMIWLSLRLTFLQESSILLSMRKLAAKHNQVHHLEYRSSDNGSEAPGENVQSIDIRF